MPSELDRKFDDMLAQVTGPGGRLIIGDRAINTAGEYLTVEIAFSNMRWYGLALSTLT